MLLDERPFLKNWLSAAWVKLNRKTGPIMHARQYHGRVNHLQGWSPVACYYYYYLVEPQFVPLVSKDRLSLKKYPKGY